MRTALIGGLYNDLAPLADAFDDVGGLLGELGGTRATPTRSSS